MKDAFISRKYVIMALIVLASLYTSYQVVRYPGCQGYLQALGR